MNLVIFCYLVLFLFLVGLRILMGRSFKNWSIIAVIVVHGIYNLVYYPFADLLNWRSSEYTDTDFFLVISLSIAVPCLVLCVPKWRTAWTSDSDNTAE